MKIIEKIKKKKVEVFLLSFVLFLIIFAVIDGVVSLFCLMTDNGILSVQYSTYGVLKKDVATSGKIEPTKFSPKRISEKEYYLKRANTYYYPHAWDKPGRILLKRKCGNFYYLTFGDGTRAAVTHWRYQGDDPNVKPVSLSHTPAVKCMYGNSPLIFMCAIISAVGILIVKGEGKSNKVE